MIKIAIVEDNAEDLNRLQYFLAKFCEEEKIEYNVCCFSNGINFLDSMSNDFDIIILDIEMPMLDGMSTAKRIRELGSTSNLLFVTNMAKYALQGYEVEAKGYLLKPVSYFNFVNTLKKIIKSISMHNTVSDDIVINGKQGIKIIKLSTLKYVEVIGHTLIFHTEHGDYKCTRKTLKDLENELNSPRFARCSSCFLVNFDYISTIEGNNITLFDGTVLLLSRGKKQDFIKRIVEYTD